MGTGNTTGLKFDGTFMARAAALLLLLSALVLSSARGFAAVPAAGTSIGNQASATYDDGSGTKTVTSNTVTTIVQQVASFTLTTTPQTKQGAAGTTVYFPHTVTNTGNGTDTFTLGASDAPGGFGFSSVALYPDANGDGVPDSLTPIATTGPLAAGAQFKFVAAGVVPGTATNGQTDSINVTAQGTATASPAPQQTNVDTVNVTGFAVIDVTKSISAPSGAAGTGPYTITLTYRNNGFATATNVSIVDTLPTLAGPPVVNLMTYVGSSGAWNGSATSDGAGGDPVGINYTASGNVVTAVVASVAPGVTGTVTFQVDIPSGLSPQIIGNKADTTYNNGDGATVIGPVPSNTATFQVVAGPASVSATDAGSTTDADATTNEVVLVSSAAQGSTVTFDNTITNTATGPDTFDITLANGVPGFPAGTTFLLFKSDGVSPLLDTNGNGTPDTGVVAAGASYHVFVKAVLPSNATGGPFNLIKTARSVADPTKSDTVTDRLGTISTNSVDLTNDTAGGPGVGQNTTAVSKTNTVAAGGTTTFTLVVNNTTAVGAPADNFDLSATAPSPLPTGWTLVFKADGGAGDCSTTGANITNTGNVNPGANRVVCAVITVAANAAAGDTDFTFRVASGASGASDSKVDRVTVSVGRNVAITPNNTGQTAPGNIVDYQHTITNGGNVTEAITFPGTFLNNTLSGWGATAFLDSNGNGVVDVGEPQISNATTFNLAPGASQQIVVRVTAPLAATTGQINQTTISVTATAGGVPQVISATDTTNVIVGVLDLLKEQALDATCDGTPDGAYSTANITTGAIPGACIRYRVTASNNGTAALISIVISDSTPANTVYDNGSRDALGGVCGTGAVDAAAALTVAGSPGPAPSAPACNSTGTVSANVGTLNPGQNAVLTFGVMINNQ